MSDWLDRWLEEGDDDVSERLAVPDDPLAESDRAMQASLAEIDEIYLRRCAEQGRPMSREELAERLKGRWR